MRRSLIARDAYAQARSQHPGWGKVWLFAQVSEGKSPASRMHPVPEQLLRLTFRGMS